MNNDEQLTELVPTPDKTNSEKIQDLLHKMNLLLQYLQAKRESRRKAI